VLVLSSIGFYHGNLHFMPVFTPNDYLFEHHKEKATQKWEIFAWAIRDAIAERADLIIDDRPIRDKMAYEKFIELRSDEIKTVAGEHFKAFPDDNSEIITEDFAR